MSTPQDQAEKWRRVADLIAALGLVDGHQDGPMTAAQAHRMPIEQLLRDPVRAAIYRRGWADSTRQIRRQLQAEPPTPLTQGQPRTGQPLPPRPAQRGTGQPLPPRPAQRGTGYQRPLRTETNPQTVREPTQEPGPSVAAPTPRVKVRTAAQQARMEKKFQQLKAKRQARALTASQQHRLARVPASVSEPEAASRPPSTPTPEAAMEVDAPATKGDKPQALATPTSQEQPDRPSEAEAIEVDWLDYGLEPLEELDHGERVYDTPFTTPIGSPRRD